ncbi:MAG: ATP-binding cassette domain-containing protein [Bacteroidetes bacterium]|nr:ATP-binding cassette domain-containing protein [Bacteroidota bacterium]
MTSVNPITRLFQVLKLEKKEVSAIYLYSIFNGLMQLSVPLGVQAIIGFVIGSEMVSSIYILILLVIIGVLFVGVFQIKQMQTIEKIQQKIFVRYAFEFAEKIPSLDLKNIDRIYLPELVNRFFETQNIQKGLTKLLLDVPISSIQIFLGLLLLTLYNPIFIILGFILFVFTVAMLYLTASNGLKTSLKESYYKYEVVAWLQEIGRVVKSFKYGLSNSLSLKKTDDILVNFLDSRIQHFKILLLQYKVLVVFKVLITAIMLGFGTYLLVIQELNIGEFIAAEIVVLTLISAVEKLISSLDSVYDVLTGLDKIAIVTDGKLDTKGSIKINSTPIGIELIDLNFHYGDGNNVLENINLNIPPNSTVCITGPEGSGKSTLMNLIAGTYSDFTGVLLYNNLPINNYDLELLRSKIGFHLNQDDIFKGTVLENINMGNNAITNDKIMELAFLLGIENFVFNLKNGLDTESIAMGKFLPSNVIKKILLLRSLLGSPQLILLEDPCIGLEEIAKEKVNAYLLSKKINATVIISSNDMQIAKKCDYRIKMSKGKAVLVKNTTNE